jgi:hypothetical protein
LDVSGSSSEEHVKREETAHTFLPIRADVEWRL